MTTLDIATEETASQVAIGDEIRTAPRKTYPQDWPAYNAAQTSEKANFLSMLAELCATVEQPLYDFGRPSYPLADMVYAGAYKVYTKFSARRFDTDIQEAQVNGHIDVAPSFNTLNRYIKDSDLTSILIDLIERSAAPLSVVETQFAVDASGFSTSVKEHWFDHKWGKEKTRTVWKKAHILTGTRTNIVASIVITESNVHDTVMFPHLLDRASRYFELKEVSADKAYLSDKNLRYVEKLDATPYIPFKKNTTGRGSATWRRLYRYFMLNEDEWNEHYHRRSNVETTFSMVKTKFDQAVRAKSDTGQVNEILLKFLCNNICVVNQEIHELGISADFHPTLSEEPDGALC